MQITTTAKVKLITDPAADKTFNDVCKAYSAACDFVSGYVFDTQQMTCSRQMIHKQLYRTVRNDFGLMSQMACSVFRTVMSRYETVETQMCSHPYSFQCEGRRYSFHRDSEWLREPVHFHKPFAMLVRGRDWSFVWRKGERILSIGTLDGRVVVPYNHFFDDALGLGEDASRHPRLGEACLIKRKGAWYLHISMTVDAEDVTEFKRIVGHDRGLRFVITSYDGESTTFVSGADIAAKRDRYHRTRKSLQSKNTRGARRVLRRVSGRENRWMGDVNHCLSKTLTRGPDTLHVLEDLTNISFDERNLTGKDRSRQLRSWSFYDLEQKITYKAAASRSMVIKVPPAHTSQRCPKCGCIHRGNRHKSEHFFRCCECGYASNDDRIAAMNLHELGVRYLETGKLAGFPG